MVLMLLWFGGSAGLEGKAAALDLLAVAAGRELLEVGLVLAGDEGISQPGREANGAASSFCCSKRFFAILLRCAHVYIHTYIQCSVFRNKLRRDKSFLTLSFLPDTVHLRFCRIVLHNFFPYINVIIDLCEKRKFSDCGCKRETFVLRIEQLSLPAKCSKPERAIQVCENASKRAHTRKGKKIENRSQ
jgi:hypothetical protein